MSQLAKGGAGKGRRVHSIRFSDTEWDAIRRKATMAGEEPASFVREEALEGLQEPG